VSSALAPGRRRGVSRSRWVVLAFISPFVLGVVLFFGYPLVSTIVYSFEKYDQINPPTWVGMQNWHYVFDEYPRFWTALRNTAWLVVVMVSLRLVFGLAVGMLVVRVRAGVGIFRTVFYLPYLAPPVASTLVFVFLLNPGSGPVNGLLEAVGIPAPAWFTDPDWSKPALVLLSLWGIGDLMVIFTASLLDVPRELYEAAELDGAGAFGRFRFITLPTIRPILLFTTVTGVIATMQYYTQALVAGQAASGQLSSAGSRVEPGYPNGSTLTLPQLVYNLGFQNFDTGSASVIAVVMFVLAMACTVLLLKAGGGFLKTGRVG
jgi:multiple sugar transport system permease protein